VVIYTSKNDIPLHRIMSVPEADSLKLAAANIKTAKELLTSEPQSLTELTLNPDALRKFAIKALFP
jgi:hypothetical protein